MATTGSVITPRSHGDEWKVHWHPHSSTTMSESCLCTTFASSSTSTSTSLSLHGYIAVPLSHSSYPLNCVTCTGEYYRPVFGMCVLCSPLARQKSPYPLMGGGHVAYLLLPHFIATLNWFTEAPGNVDSQCISRIDLFAPKFKRIHLPIF